MSVSLMNSNIPNAKPLPPKGAPLLGLLRQMSKDPLKFFEDASCKYGDVVPLKLGLETVYLINHPKHFKHIYQDNRDNYIRSKYYGQLSSIIGDGLFTLEGKAWRRQRKSAQPAFNGPNLHAMTNIIVAESSKFVERLGNLETGNQGFDIMKEAFNLKLQIVMRALFNANLSEEDFERVLGAITITLKEIEKRIWEIFPTPLWLPTKRNRALKRANEDLRGVIEKIVLRRINTGENKEDLMDLLISAERHYGWNSRSIKSLVDQVISVAIAGHETGAISLCWLTYELSRRPEIAKRIRLEANMVFRNRKPEFGDFQKLEYTQRVFKEILRLYPPLWTVSRQAVHEDYLGDFRLPKGAIVMLSPYLLQRNPRFWKNPEKFNPDRFLPHEEEARHKFSYLPFGAGPHLCLGNRFGTLEGVLSLALVCQNLSFELVPGQTIKPQPMTTLRPAKKMFLTVQSVQPHHQKLAA